jgi:type IX secretion system PorP/SprF family membrane protein
MVRIISYIFILLSLSSGIKLSAQADISMATHWNNRANYNPAFIGRTDYLYIFSNIRDQWMGINGAPVVFNVQISEYFHSLRSAIGFSIVNDKIGATQSINPMLSYAFRIAKKNRWSLSMGLSAGIFARTLNGSLLEAETTNDPSLFNYNRKIIRPDFNVGFEFQNASFIYGISSTHILSTGKSDTLFLNTNHRYGYAIYKNNNSKLFSYNLGMQIVNRYNLTVLEGNITLRLKRQTRLIQGLLIKGPQEIIDIGLTYRTSRQMTVLCGMRVSTYLRIGYAYDQNLFSGFSRYGTHEVMIEYRIPAKAASTVTRCSSKEFWYN